MTLRHRHFIDCQPCRDLDWLESYIEGTAHLWMLIREHGRENARAGFADYGPGGPWWRQEWWDSGQVASWRDAFGGVSV
jgi:hypothetical protein